METIAIDTVDGIHIVGDYHEGASSKGALLLHMMPSDRKSWTAFAEKLASRGYHVLAIDLRGHGDSVEGPSGKLDYHSFSNEEHASSIHDVEAGAEFLSTKGADSLVLAGASIGANLALWHAARNPRGVENLILLSPGLDYKGIATEPLMIKMEPGIDIMLVSGGTEDAYSQETVKKLANLVNLKTPPRIFEDSGHGTRIFERHPEFMEELIQWLEK